jgi:ligand-binding sensor domain-containing protein
LIRLLLIFSLLISFLRGFSQEYEVAFRQFREFDGLSNEQVRCLHFGSDGYLWIGTSDGLNRFDGLEFYTYRNNKQDPSSISGNIISDIKEDSQGTLWITTHDGGVCSFNRQTQKFKSYELPSRKDGRLITMAFCLAFDEKDRIHVGTKEGVFISNNKNDFWQIEHAKYFQIMDLELTTKGLLVGAIVVGISEIQNDQFYNQQVESYAPLPSMVVERYFQDSKQRIWAGAWDNMFHELLPNKKMRHIDFSGAGVNEMNGYEIHAITEVEEDVLWLGIRNGDIWRFDTRTDKAAPLRISKYVNTKINGNVLYSMITDPYGRVWIGTNAGLYMHDPSKLGFNVTWLEDDNHVNLFHEHKGKIYMGTGNGLYALDSAASILSKIEEFPDKEIHSLYTDNLGELYIGTNRSIYQYNETSNTYDYPFFINKQFALEAIPSSRVNGIGETTIDGVDLLLVNTYGHGIILVNRSNKEFILANLFDGTRYDNLINQIYMDSQHKPWLIGNILGVMNINSVIFRGGGIDLKNWDLNYSVRSPSHCVSDEFVQEDIPRNFNAITEDKPGEFWIAARSFGLLKFNSKEKNKFFTKINSSPRTIDSMVKDKLGNLWMNSSGSLFCFEPTAERWTKYSFNDGIPHQGLSGKLYVTQSGDVLVGGNGFFLYFNPQISSTKIESPRTTLTHIKIMDSYSDSLIGTSNFSINADQNFITFQFSSLQFGNPESISYEYTLQGLDNVWHSAAKDNLVSFRQLPYGEYVFRLRVQQTDSETVQQEISQRFTVVAPFYRRTWFMSMIFLIATFLILSFVRYRLKQRQKMDKVRNKIARDLHDDIGSALGSIS